MLNLDEVPEPVAPPHEEVNLGVIYDKESVRLVGDKDIKLVLRGFNVLASQILDLIRAFDYASRSVEDFSNALEQAMSLAPTIAGELQTHSRQHDYHAPEQTIRTRTAVNGIDYSDDIRPGRFVHEPPNNR